MPAIAPAALARIRAEIAVDPRDVDDRVHHRHVGGADVAAACRPRRASRRSASARRPAASRIARVGDRRAAGAADGGDPVEPPLGVEPRATTAAPRPSPSTAAPRSPARRERGRVGAARAATSSRVTSGATAARCARVDEHDVDALLAQRGRAGTRTRLPSCRACRPGRRSPSPSCSRRAARRRGSAAAAPGPRELRRGRLGEDRAGDHHQLALGERGRHAEVLLDQQDREALLLEPS